MSKQLNTSPSTEHKTNNRNEDIMSHWEKTGITNEWYTPKYIFDALECHFDLDAASPIDRTHCCVPAKEFITKDSLNMEWNGFVWLNPPFGGRNGIIPWIQKMISHNDGILLTPDRSSSKWWQLAAKSSSAIMMIAGKVKFIDINGNIGKNPSNGITLFAYGENAINALKNASINDLGLLLFKQPI